MFLFLLITSNSFSAEDSFNLTLVIKKSLTITETRSLNFGNVESTGRVKMITVSPGDDGAASFKIDGDENSATFSVLERRIYLYSSSNRIRVKDFKVSPVTATLPINEVTVGATAKVNANQHTGVYTGSATFSVVYN